jgi:hypothetical protein
LRHLLHGNRTKASLSAMIMDRSILLPRRVGWSHELSIASPTSGNINGLDLTNPRIVRLLYANLTRALAAKRRESFQSSSLSHVLEIFPTLSIPRSFGEILGQVPFETVRVFILYAANLSRFCFFRPNNDSDQSCPFCGERFYSRHFFECDQYSALGDEPTSWSDLVRLFLRQEWLDGISSVMRRLAGWSRRAHGIFRPHFRHRVVEYYEELQWLRRDRIRRAGGDLPPGLPWSISS